MNHEFLEILETAYVLYEIFQSTTYLSNITKAPIQRKGLCGDKS